MRLTHVQLHDILVILKSVRPHRFVTGVVVVKGLAHEILSRVLAYSSSPTGIAEVVKGISVARTKEGEARLTKQCK